MVLSNSNRRLLFEGGEYWTGDKLPDGTVFAGISPDTGKPLYTTPADAGKLMGWKQACDFATALDASGYRDWRLPTQNELDVLWKGRNFIGGFSLTGWYWSSSSSNFGPLWVQRFSDGYQFSYAHRSEGICVRCVRG